MISFPLEILWIMHLFMYILQDRSTVQIWETLNAVFGLYAWKIWSVASTVSKNPGNLVSRFQGVQPWICGSHSSGLAVHWAAETGSLEEYLWDRLSGEFRMLSWLRQALKLTLLTFCKNIIQNISVGGWFLEKLKQEEKCCFKTHNEVSPEKSPCGQFQVPFPFGGREVVILLVWSYPCEQHLRQHSCCRVFDSSG